MGTAENDIGSGITSDSSGNVYVTGYTLGALDGNTSAGSIDLFVRSSTILMERSSGPGNSALPVVMAILLTTSPVTLQAMSM